MDDIEQDLMNSMIVENSKKSIQIADLQVDVQNLLQQRDKLQRRCKELEELVAELRARRC